MKDTASSAATVHAPGSSVPAVATAFVASITWNPEATVEYDALTYPDGAAVAVVAWSSRNPIATTVVAFCSVSTAGGFGADELEWYPASAIIPELDLIVTALAHEAVARPAKDADVSTLTPIFFVNRAYPAVPGAPYASLVQPELEHVMSVPPSLPTAIRTWSFVVVPVGRVIVPVDAVVKLAVDVATTTGDDAVVVFERIK